MGCISGLSGSPIDSAQGTAARPRRIGSSGVQGDGVRRVSETQIQPARLSSTRTLVTALQGEACRGRRFPPGGGITRRRLLFPAIVGRERSETFPPPERAWDPPCKLSL